MKRLTMNSVERLLSLGGSVGSKLAGRDEDGERIIQILEIQGTKVLAKCVERDGEECDGFESNWSLNMREWKLVK